MSENQVSHMNACQIAFNCMCVCVFECLYHLKKKFNRISIKALLVKYITRRFIGDYDPTYEGCWSKCELIDGCETLIHIYDTYDKVNCK